MRKDDYKVFYDNVIYKYASDFVADNSGYRLVDILTIEYYEDAPKPCSLRGESKIHP